MRQHPAGMDGGPVPDGAGAPAVGRDPRFLRGGERGGEGGGAAPGAPAPAAPPVELEGDVLPFLRPRSVRRPRRLRRSPWRRLLRPLATAVLVVTLPTSLAAWVLTSPRFELSDVRLAGPTRQVDPVWVAGRLAPLHGRNLVQLPLAEVEEALAGHPWIEGVAIRKQLPDALAVEIRERRPAVLVPAPAERGEGALWLADRTGRPIVPAPPGAAEDYVTVVAAADRRPGEGPLAGAVPGALAVAADLARHHPVWAAALERIEALGEDEYRVVTTALPFPILVRSGEVEPRAGYLEAALPELRRRFGGVAVVDLRFAGRLVVRPTGEPAPAPAAGSGPATQGGTAPALQRDDLGSFQRRSDQRREVG